MIQYRKVLHKGENTLNIGFIGFGNMAQAIAKGLLENKIVEANDLIFSNQTEEKRKTYEKQFNIKGSLSNQKVWDHSEIIVLAVKPYQIEAVLKKIEKSHQPFVISVVAGVTNDELEKFLPKHSFLRTMPNLNSQVGEGMTAIVNNESVATENLTKTKQIFEAVGEIVELPESQLGAFIALAGSSPALVFMFIDTLSRAAVKYGIPKKQATKIAAQAVLGSGKTVLQSDQSPWTLIDQVSSPGGITVDGILSLLQDDFSGSIIRSVDSMIEKNSTLSKE